MHGVYEYSFGIGHISMVLLWIAVIGLILWVILSPKGIPSIQKESPLDIAKKRYAKGEITQEEFDDIKRQL